MRRRSDQQIVQALAGLCIVLALMCAWLAWQAARAHQVAACYREVMATMEAPPEGIASGFERRRYDVGRCFSRQTRNR